MGVSNLHFREEKRAKFNFLQIFLPFSFDYSPGLLR